ncbi:MAG: glycosyltransferase family 2 protein [Candidatus Omnitrophica bacterium]|nr:glycosyltransferase family 2 protein [Candidatus Omnitrophota bacterium]
MAVKDIDISIVIRTKNEESSIARVLERVSVQSYPGNYEIIIIDSGSTDRTAQIVSGFAVNFQVINKEPFSYGYALNYGQKLSSGRIIVFLSAHCVPVDAQWLSNLLAPLEKDKHAGAAYGRQLPVKGVNPVEEFELGIFFPQGNLPPKAVFSNANCAIRKEILEQHPFNEEIAYGEDFLWRNKLPADIGVVYARDAQVYHSHPSSLRYWVNHHQRIGMAGQYLQRVEGVEDFYGRKGSWLRKALSRLRYMVFFIRKGYLKAFFVFPALELIRSIFYVRGVKIGKKKYAGYSRKIVCSGQNNLL